VQKLPSEISSVGSVFASGHGGHGFDPRVEAHFCSRPSAECTEVGSIPAHVHTDNPIYVGSISAYAYTDNPTNIGSNPAHTYTDNPIKVGSIPAPCSG